MSRCGKRPSIVLLLAVLLSASAARAADVQTAVTGAQAALYGTGDLAKAEKLAREALQQDPASPGAHEVLWALAELRGDDEGVYRHALAAAAGAGSDTLRLVLGKVDGASSTPARWRETLDLLLTLAERLPDAGDAAFARAMAARYLFRSGEVEEAKSQIAKLSYIRDWLVVAGFENDRMKGFDVEYGPETDGVDPSATYKGQQRPIGWRHIDTLDEQGRMPHIQLQSPNSWSIAYMATFVRSDEARDAELRLTSDEPIKAWLNDGLVIEARHVAWALPDHLVVPIRLEAGWNKLLVKSCQDTGKWETAVRITAPGGGPLTALVARGEPHPTPTVAKPARTFDVEKDVLGRYEAISEPNRRAFIKAYMMSREGFPKLSSERFDELLAASQASPIALLHGAIAAWEQSETEKMLERFAEGLERYPNLPAFPYQRARYFKESDRTDRAIEDVEAALEVAPHFLAAQRLLTNLFRDKGWTEEACKRFEELHEEHADRVGLLSDLADCATGEGRYPEARELYRKILELRPTERSVLDQLATLATRRDDYDEAIELYERTIELYPYRTDPFLGLGDVYRVLYRYDDARAAYQEASDRDPEYSWPHQKLGDLYMDKGRPADAAAEWKMALERNPDDHVLWERVERISPDESDLLAPYVPTDSQIDDVLAGRKKVEVLPGASSVLLLDHEAMQLNLDGSSRRVVTMVTLIADEEGRDRYSTFKLPGSGHLRVIRAFVVDPDGGRQEVSSLRDRTIRFQDLRVGSTIVLQYRHDAVQQTFLNNHWYGTWYFQQDSGQSEQADWILVVPKQRKLQVHVQGDVKQAVETQGDQLVYHFSAHHVPPLQIEPQSLPLSDLGALVSASTIPDWEFFARWEWTMVEESLRATPDLERKARAVVSNTASPQEKVDAIYRFVANDVRYVQDYEERIAGVRPHPASMTYERRYGDCKDKVVLMMSLLNASGVEARFAMLSTASAGKLRRDVPSQQFNHAIVYVPKQEGLDASRFYDPTAEHLDLGNLRWDVQGRTALVLWEGHHEFVDIPYDPPERELELVEADITLAPVDESSDVSLVLLARGRAASGIRKAVTNDETARRMIEGFTCGYLYPGARLVSYAVEGQDDITAPVRISVKLLAPNLVTAEDRTLRMNVLDYGRIASKYAKWKERRFPLYFGPPETVRVSIHATPPKGYSLSRLPQAATAEGPCLTLTLTPRRDRDGSATVQYEMVRTCAELPAAEYEGFRDATLKISRVLSEPVVFKK